MKKICIVGTADTIYNIPYDTHEIWLVGTATKLNHIKKADRIFEIHERWRVEDLIKNGHMYTRFQCPIYVRDCNEYDGLFPHIKYFPGKEIMETFNDDYFTNSIAWMIAWAILEKVDEITIVGVHLDNAQEYTHERPCVEYWLGRAKERGINVVIPKDSYICHKHFLYGYDEVPSTWEKIASKRKLTERMIKEAIAGYNKALVTATQIQTMKGMFQDLSNECEYDVPDYIKDYREKIRERLKELPELNEEMLRCKEIFDRFFGANLMLDLFER